MKKVLVLLIISLCFFASGVFAAGTVDINTASLAQLDTLTGIGPTYAQRIVDGRPYASVDDLLNVKGIGPVTLQKIKDQGLACVNCASTQEISDDQPPVSNTPANTSISTSNSTLTSPENQNSQQPPNTAPVIYPSGIFINEILPNPVGPDGTDEWIELYNSNSSDVDLSGWQLQDRAGTITTYTIPSVTKIMAGSFLVFKRPETNIMLNNDGDGINLIAPNGKIVDAMGFMNAPLGQSYSRTASDWSWSTTLTPGAANIITAVAKTSSAPATIKTSTASLPKTQNSANNNNTNPAVADLSQAIPAQASPWPLFLIVLGATIILAIIVLFIKFKLNKNVRT